jgi:hypothetical protein
LLLLQAFVAKMPPEREREREKERERKSLSCRQGKESVAPTHPSTYVEGGRKRGVIDVGIPK